MILVVVAIVLLFWYSLSFVFRTDHPILAVASESMEPVLYKGDLILIEGIDDASNIHAATKDAEIPGDIIVFSRHNELIVHRAVEKISNGDGTYSFKTWGDNNNWPDGWTVEEGDIVGRYLNFKVPLLGHIALAFSDFTVKVILVIFCALILISLEFFPLWRKKAKQQED
jgi:signal peptidase